MRFQMCCCGNEWKLLGKSCKNQLGQPVFLGEALVEAHVRSDLKATIDKGACSRLRRTAAVLAGLLLFSFLSVLGQREPCDALATAIGDTIQVSGVVDSPVTRNSTGNWAWFYISETGCRIRVYYGQGNLPWLAKGNRVLITGDRSEFNNEPEIIAQSVAYMEANTASGNRLLLMVLVVSGVSLTSIAAVAARRRHGRISADRKPRPGVDADMAGVYVRSAETLAGQNQHEDHNAGSYSGHVSVPVLHKQDHSPNRNSITRPHRIKRDNAGAYERWSAEEDERLVELTQSGSSVQQISETLERPPEEMQSRLKKLDHGKHLQNFSTDTKIFPEMATGERSRELRSSEIAFLPLAVSSMKEDALCVAGIDVKTGIWIRLVRERMYSLKEAEAAVFRDRSLMAVRVGASQRRSHSLDPRGLHTEDRVIKGAPRKITPLDPGDKLALLESAVDKDLERALSTRRSLFVVEPTKIRLIPREGKQPKIAFETPTTSTDALRSSCSLEGNLIGISSFGCPCNCLAWKQAPEPLGRSRTHNDVLRVCPGARIFLALSLTGLPSELPPEKRKHYLLVAGIHVIGRDRVWL